MAPIAADYMHVPAKTPGTFAIINEAASICEGGACSFTMNASLTPTLVNATVVATSKQSSSTIHLYGTKLVPERGVNSTNSSISDIRVYVRRGNISSAVADVWSTERCIVDQAEYSRIVCTLPVTPAGAHNVQAIIPGRGASNNVTLTLSLSLASISPNTVSAALPNRHYNVI